MEVLVGLLGMKLRMDLMIKEDNIIAMVNSNSEKNINQTNTLNPYKIIVLFVGNLDNWWKIDTFFKFLNKTRCIIEQYGNYSAPSINLNLNGINTQGENIADNGGIKEAYRAYGTQFDQRDYYTKLSRRS